MDISQVKKNLGRKVVYNGTEYLFSGCIIRPDEQNGFYYQAELQDLKANNSVIICALPEVKENKNENCFR